MPNIRNARPVFAALGGALGLGSPLGWMVLTNLGMSVEARSVYAYLTITAVVALAAAGYGIGYLYERVKLLGDRDDLTSLFNQNAFLRTASFLLQLAIRHKEPIAFLMMDIDHFKDVNDHHNHLVGTHVLKELAVIITDCTRKSDLTARFGGDEFVLCLPRTGYEDAHLVAERIRTSVENRTFVLRDHSVRVTVSIGIVSAIGAQGLDLNRLLEEADQALYGAKDHGRNQVVNKRFGA